MYQEAELGASAESIQDGRAETSDNSIESPAATSLKTIENNNTILLASSNWTEHNHCPLPVSVEYSSSINLHHNSATSEEVYFEINISTFFLVFLNPLFC